MPGFSAPKLLWLSRHEPDAMARARRILLTKDYIRLRLTGEAASDRADASATLLMDTARGDWHDGILAACGIDRARLPRLVESAAISGTLRGELASALASAGRHAGGGRRRRQHVRAASAWARCRLVRPTSAWERRASTSSPTIGSCRHAAAACTPIATPCRACSPSMPSS